jgi:hypothetical protein
MTLHKESEISVIEAEIAELQAELDRADDAGQITRLRATIAAKRQQIREAKRPGPFIVMREGRKRRERRHV